MQLPLLTQFYWYKIDYNTIAHLHKSNKKVKIKK